MGSSLSIGVTGGKTVKIRRRERETDRATESTRVRREGLVGVCRDSL